MDKKDTSTLEEIKDNLRQKAGAKQDAYKVTHEVFEELKDVMTEIAGELQTFAGEIDERIGITISCQGEFECQLVLAGDTVVYHMHTNIFSFPPSHMIHKSPYVMKNPLNAYCGVINIYNFLTDSFRYHRVNDSGYLIGRIFVNRERHFIVEGQGQLGRRFNDFSTSHLDRKTIREVMETAIRYILDFELYTPPYYAVKEVRVSDIMELNHNLKLKTAKRLGFKFENDEEHGINF